MRRGGRGITAALAGAAIAICAGAALPAAAGAQATTPTFTPAACPAPLPTGAVEGRTVVCGTVAVPLDHAQPQGPAITLSVAVLRSTAGKPKKDPIMWMGGGPGEKDVQLISTLPSPQALTGVRSRDLVLWDQRGVGFSSPSLECPEFASTDPATFPASFASCRGRLGATTDLSKYTTAQTVQDANWVRRALGARKVNLYGNSYGSDVALTAMKTEGHWIRSVVLASVVPPQSNFVRDLAPNFDRALAAVGRRCAKARSCRALVPGGFTKTLDAVLARLAAAPQSVSVTDPATGQPTTVTITASLVAGLVYQAYYLPKGPQALPAIVAVLNAGRFDLLGGGGSSTPTDSSPISTGLQISVLCAETVSRTSAAQVVATARKASPAAQLIVAGAPIVGLNVFAGCATWGVPARPAAAKPVSSSIPTLVVNGEFDQITPPSYGRRAARRLSDSTTIEVAGAGHSALVRAGTCGARIYRAFVDAPGRRLSSGCTQRFPKFITASSTASAATIARASKADLRALEPYLKVPTGA